MFSLVANHRAPCGCGGLARCMFRASPAGPTIAISSATMWKDSVHRRVYRAICKCGPNRKALVPSGRPLTAQALIRRAIGQGILVTNGNAVPGDTTFFRPDGLAPALGDAPHLLLAGFEGHLMELASDGVARDNRFKMGRVGLEAVLLS